VRAQRGRGCGERAEGCLGVILSGVSPRADARRKGATERKREGEKERERERERDSNADGGETRGVRREAGQGGVRERRPAARVRLIDEFRLEIFVAPHARLIEAARARPRDGRR